MFILDTCVPKGDPAVFPCKATGPNPREYTAALNPDIFCCSLKFVIGGPFARECSQVFVNNFNMITVESV